MTIEGDFASSWEIADEGTTVIMKVRGLKWDERAPTNGRVSDAEDVVFAWNRWVESNARAYEVANEWNPNGAVLNVTAPDAETAVFKLAFPYGPLFPMMSDGYHLLVFPREADGGYDPRSEARGTGAWFVEEDTWPTAIRFKRNPNWYESDRPYFDEWIVNNVSDYSAGVAQLRTGGLDKYDPTSQEDVLLTKKDVPSLVMVQQANFTKALGGVTFFGQQPGSPYLDDRVRKAMSMLLDRDLWLDTYSNRERFESEGLPVETTWTGWVGPGYEFHLDPREDDLGEGAKFMRYDPEGAQELLAAAGVSLPIESTFWAANNTLTPEREALLGMIQATGAFKANIHSVPLDEFLDATATPGRAWDFEGFGMQTYNETADWDWVHSLMFDPRSTNFQIPQEDPKMTDFYQQQRRELDQQKRGEILKEFQRYAAQTMYYVPVPGGQWKNFRIAQPWIGNWGYFSGWEGFAFGQELYTHYWYDESKA